MDGCIIFLCSNHKLQSILVKYLKKTHTPTLLSVVLVCLFVFFYFQESYKELRSCVIIIPRQASSSCSAYSFDHALILVNTLQIVQIAHQ